ncbi:hypothetical protein HC028_11430 [Planosporangium flavigriseum]|uniref:DUF6458 domain-containing protein n=1 Tax=Planosporangium flavigriseum TaxID=373681 RepID=A0A8J3LRA0_9ACTN|nr:DUF6458 family protein [Planosporangium flavigriseum]NJC65109.1 hypothetical protein [Planosporangium flavigriseum]GIG71725.1 hypothetical protein Pfl04_01290 [Planosporangium flavigriseum]
MGIGGSILLIVIGAILTFALNVQLGAVNLDLVGWIMMAAGLLGLIITTYIWSSRRRTVVSEGPAGYRRVEERTDPYEPM